MNILRRLLFNYKYYFSPSWDTGISPPELIDFINIHPPGRALDLGCGTGTNVITLAQNGWHVTGIDFSWKAIQIAQRKAQQAGIDAHIRNGDVTNASIITQMFDFILDIGCFHSLPQNSRQAYLHNLQALLAPNGTYLLYTFIRANVGNGHPGITNVELTNFPQNFHLVGRQDTTERGYLQSAWLTYHKHTDYSCLG